MAAQIAFRDRLAEVRPHERAPAARPFVYVNMVTSVDGRAAIGGTTRELGQDADLEMLLELRELADAVLIGTGTLRAEPYDRLVRSADRRARRAAAGLAEDPPAVLLSRGLDLPWDARLFQAPEQPVLVYTGAEAKAPAVPAAVEVVRLADPSPAAALADLRARGVRALLCEGGPTLAGRAAGGRAGRRAVPHRRPGPDRRGGGAADRRGRRSAAPVRLEPLWVLRAGDELFLRYAVR